ncbi:MAG TPA: molybdopterin-dependent oxidoreductase, partial [Mycobacteriales bacterium]|nr:molybdopterin-dependent oxidoreductase [Mycobacteriales bacterium]
AAIWGTEISERPGRDTTAILAAAAAGELPALLVGGVDLDDLPDPDLARKALQAAGFVVSLELRHSSVTEYADVVLPVAPTVNKAGSFVNWEGRHRPFEQAIPDSTLPDSRVLDTLAAEMDAFLGLATVEQIRAEQANLPAAGGPAEMPDYPAAPIPTPQVGEAVLATWHHLLDSGVLQDGEKHLAGTARKARALLSAATAAEIGAVEGDAVAVSTEHGRITLPLLISDLPDRVVWLPTNSAGSAVRSSLRVDSGALVRISTEKKSGETL